MAWVRMTGGSSKKGHYLGNGYSFVGSSYTQSGWNSVAKAVPTINFANGKVTITAGKQTSTYAVGTAYLTPTPPKAGKTVLKMKISNCSIGTNCQLVIGETNSFVSGFTVNRTFTPSLMSGTSDQIISMNVADLTSYMVVVMFHQAPSSAASTITIDDLWFE